LKRVLVTSRIVKDPNHHETRDALDLSWGIFLEMAGVLPIAVPSSFDITLALATLNIQGIILTGGNDLAAISGDEVDLLRENRERFLIEYACAHSLPLLGICRGMQLLVTYFGGSVGPIEGHVGVTHPIQPVRGGDTLVFQERRRIVNSFHHFGITALSADCVPCARTCDGWIEAMRHQEYPCLGVMWHPERETPVSDDDLRMVRECFANG
jgi:putative glutamine amidotransferase